MLLSKYRKSIDTFAPVLGVVYRSLRERTTSSRVIRTNYGFSLTGSVAIASEGYETEEVKTFLDLLGNHDTVVDIGANIGFYSCLAAHRGKHVISVEPSARNLNFLCRNLWQNQLSTTEVFPVGLARQPGLKCIYGFGGIASFIPGWGQAPRTKYSIVPVTTLDTITASRLPGNKLLIKMDVEGFELEVLAGATDTLVRSPKPTWLVEIMLRNDLIPGGINSRFAETFNIFWDRGYHCRRLDSGRTPVLPQDVSRWVANGFVDSGMHDFLFVPDSVREGGQVPQ